MLRLELDDREQDALAEALRSYLSDLRTEVSHTDRLDYRKRLRAHERLMQTIVERVERTERAP